MLWLVMEEVCPNLRSAYVALFSDNSPTIVWVKRLAVRGSLSAMQIVWAPTLRLKKVDYHRWHLCTLLRKKMIWRIFHHARLAVIFLGFEKNTDLLKNFNKNFPLPNQASWTVFIPSNAVSMKVISVLQIQNFEMGEWLQLKKSVKHVGKFVFLCQTFGIGSLATGCHVPAAS